MATSETEWIDKLNPDELRALTSPELVKDVERIFKVRLHKGELVTNAEAPPPKPSVFDIVGNELFLFLCTKNKRYRELRTKLNSKSTTVGVAAVATEFGVRCGSPVAGSVIAAMLLVFLTIGKNVACTGLESRYGQK